MSQFAVESVPKILTGIKPSACIEQTNKKISAEMFSLAIIMAVIQVMDGILTGIGIKTFGVHVEGNLLVRTLMHTLGFVEALFVVKAFAIVVIILLSYQSINIKWIPKAMKGVIGIYLMLAVVPWTFVLLNY